MGAFVFPHNLHMHRFFFAIIFGLTLWPSSSTAQVVISEIMYDLPGTDTNREWVEIQNTGSEAVHIVTGSGGSSWRLFVSAAHVLTLVNGSELLEPGQYAVIARNAEAFLSDWPGFSGTLFISAFASLNNTAGAVSLRVAGSDIDGVSYSSGMGASGDGNSLQRTDAGTWVAAIPTPGAYNAQEGYVVPENEEEAEENQNATTTPSNSQQQNTPPPPAVVSTHFSYVNLSPLQNTTKEEDLQVSAGRHRIAAAGSPIQFGAETNKGTLPSRRAAYEWSFGDGAVAYGETVEHVYEYPGKYEVVLNLKFDKSSSVSRTTVEVFNPSLEIKRAGQSGLEVKNAGSKEINLYKWRVRSSGLEAPVYGEVIILPGASVVLNLRKVFGGAQYGQDLALVSPIGEIFGLSDVRPVQAPRSAAPSQAAPSSAANTRTSAFVQVVSAQGENNSGGAAAPEGAAAVFAVPERGGMFSIINSIWSKIFAK